MKTIIGTRTSESWEKQTFYKLSNGFTACLEFNQCHGEYVKRIDFPDGNCWCASDGLDPDYQNDPDEIIRNVFRRHKPCPEFARAWLDKSGLIRPGFTKVFDHQPARSRK